MQFFRIGNTSIDVREAVIAGQVAQQLADFEVRPFDDNGVMRPRRAVASLAWCWIPEAVPTKASHLTCMLSTRRATSRARAARLAKT